MTVRETARMQIILKSDPGGQSIVLVITRTHDDSEKDEPVGVQIEIMRGERSLVVSEGEWERVKRALNKHVEHICEQVDD